MAPQPWLAPPVACYGRSKHKSGPGVFGRFSALRGRRRPPEAPGKGTDPARKVVPLALKISSGHPPNLRPIRGQLVIVGVGPKRMERYNTNLRAPKVSPDVCTIFERANTALFWLFIDSNVDIDFGDFGGPGAPGGDLPKTAK